jgi:transposase
MESAGGLGRLIGMTPTVEASTDLVALRADNEYLRQQVRQLLATVAELRTINDKQQAHIDYLVRMTFGRKSERMEGPTLFDDLPDAEATTVPEPPPADEPDVTVAAHRRRGHGRKPLPKDLPRQSHEVDLSEAEKLCPCCGTLRARIGADTSERLDYHPASLFIRATVRPKYACSNCERQGDSPQVVQPPLPPEPIPRGIAAPGLLSYLLVSKYIDHLPLYRLEGIFARLGWDVSRSTLCDLTMRCGQVMTPLYRLMCRRVLLGHSLHTDDTALVLLDPRRTAHAWVYVGDAAHPYTVFDLSVGHSHEFPQAFLKGYIGFIHADGFAGYDAIYQAGAIHAGCWAHARRYFFDARLVSPELAHEALARIRTLYAVEADAKALHHTGTELAAYRREHAGPVLDAFALWLAKRAPQVLPKSKIGEAFTYATNQWPSLGVYLTDGRLTIDNHPAEQAIRPLAVGRRNWLHIGGDGGLQPAAVLLSMAASAKRHALNPWEYFRHVLTELPARPPNADLTDLLPDLWARSRAGPAPPPAAN